MSRASEQCPARLKATLTNFRSYCQKACSSLIPLANNASITKYRSYRQMKLQTYKAEFTPTFASKKQSRFSPSRKEDSSLNFKQNELIDLIKHKLRQKTSFDQRVKTDVYQKEEATPIRFQKRNAEMVTHFVNTSKMVKAIKRKKIDLTITNSKIGLFVREERPTKSSEIVIAIKERPCSAIEYRTVYLPNKESQPKFSAKQSAHYIHGQREQRGETRQQTQPENRENERGREISGWEFQSHEEPFLEEVQSSKKKGRQKKKGQAKRQEKV